MQRQQAESPEPTSLRWYRIIATRRREELPFAHFYLERYERKD